MSKAKSGRVYNTVLSAVSAICMKRMKCHKDGNFLLKAPRFVSFVLQLHLHSNWIYRMNRMNPEGRNHARGFNHSRVYPIFYYWHCHRNDSHPLPTTARYVSHPFLLDHYLFRSKARPSADFDASTYSNDESLRFILQTHFVDSQILSFNPILFASTYLSLDWESVCMQPIPSFSRGEWLVRKSRLNDIGPHQDFCVQIVDTVHYHHCLSLLFVFPFSLHSWLPRSLFSLN